MSVNAKHLATFVLGAAAGVALNKYLQTEEGEKLMNDLKAKGSQLKTDAEGAVDNAPQYFEKLKEQLSQFFKTNFPNAEGTLEDLFGKSSVAGQPERTLPYDAGFAHTPVDPLTDTVQEKMQGMSEPPLVPPVKPS